MSRSYKRTPIYTDYSRKTTKYFKRQASHKIRRSTDVPDGRAYRKFYCSWYIHDRISYWPKEVAIVNYAKNQEFYQNFYGSRTLDEYINTVWKKYYFRK